MEYLAHFRYKPTEAKEKAKAELDKLSSVERETLASLSQAFGVTVYVRNLPGGKLITIHQG